MTDSLSHLSYHLGILQKEEQPKSIRRPFRYEIFVEEINVKKLLRISRTFVKFEYYAQLSFKFIYWLNDCPIQ